MEVEIEKTIQVVALLDSGAYSNYVSRSWVEDNQLSHRVIPVEGQVIQLGGTDKILPVLGRISLSVRIGNEAARLTFVVFDSSRECIIGLESLVIHFLDLFHSKLKLLQTTIYGTHSLNALAKLFPKEPGKHTIDPADVQTGLERGEEVWLGESIEEAPEEQSSEEEHKEIFRVPPPALGLTEEELTGMVPEELKSIRERGPDGEFDFYSEMRALLRSSLGSKVFTFKDWTGIKWDPVTIQLADGAPPYLHSKVRNVVQQLYEPAKNALRN